MGFLSDIFASILGAKISTDQQNAANNFNATQAEINRDFQSYEAALNRDWQSREAEDNRDFQSREAEVARIFNSNEAALQRDWSSQEAERARDWQEEMYAKYNSLSGKISQAESAGVNPMFAITGNAVSPMSATSSAPSGASASGGAASGSSVGGAGLPSGSSASAALVDIVGNMLGMAKLRSEIDLNEARAFKDRKEGEGQQITNEQLHDMNAAEIMSKLSQVELNDANIELIVSKVLNTEADTAVKGAQLGQIAAEIANTEADTNVKVAQVGLVVAQTISETKSLDVMSAQIAEMASNVALNKEKGKEIAQNVRNLVQQYGHDKVINEFNEIIAAAQASDAAYKNPASYTGISREIRQVLNEFKEIFSFSGTTSPK